LPIDALSDRRIRQDFFDWRDQFASTPRTADYAWSILRRVLSWAYDRGKIDINHAIKPGRLYDSDRSELIWLLHGGEPVAGRPRNLPLPLPRNLLPRRPLDPAPGCGDNAAARS
jgi:hypothetical protein